MSEDKKNEMVELNDDQVEQVAGGGPTEEDNANGLKVYCDTCQRLVMARPTGKDDGAFFYGENMNTYAPFVMEHFGAKQLMMANERNPRPGYFFFGLELSGIRTFVFLNRTS